jgi:hypothetical protein
MNLLQSPSLILEDSLSPTIELVRVSSRVGVRVTPKIRAKG